MQKLSTQKDHRIIRLDDLGKERFNKPFTVRGYLVFGNTCFYYTRKGSTNTPFDQLTSLLNIVQTFAVSK